VLSGTFRGWRGVVEEISWNALNRPMIRLLLDERGDRVPEPVELDLRRRPDVQIQALAHGAAPYELGVAV
jgi:hypothetical protein